jgi:hypothetical protein
MQMSLRLMVSIGHSSIAYEGTDIQFNNSVFYHMSNLNKGTVLHADYQQVVATFYD